MPADDVMVGGVDLFDFGWEMIDLPNMHGHRVAYSTGRALSGPPVLLDPNPVVSPRFITLRGILTGSGTDGTVVGSLIGRLRNIQSLWAGSGEATLEIPAIHRTGRWYTHLAGISTRRIPGRSYDVPSPKRAAIYLDISCFCPDPWLYSPGSTVALSGSATTISLAGDAPTRRWTAELVVPAGAVDPGIRFETAAGDLLSKIQFDKTLTAGATIEMDMHRATISGLAIEDLADDADFPVVLDPRTHGASRVKWITGSGTPTSGEVVIQHAHYG